MPKKPPRPLPTRQLDVTATLHEAADVCAINNVVVKTVLLLPTEAPDTCVITGPAREVLQLTEAADTGLITGVVSFLTTARMPLTEAADGTAITAVNVNQQDGLMPPFTSLVSAEGTWTLDVNNQVLLNGVGTATFGTPVRLLAGTIYVHTGNYWSQWFQNSGVFGTGFGPLVSFGDVDPITYVNAPAPAYTGPANTADIWEMDPTSFAVVQGYTPQTINTNINPHNAEFATDSLGIPYVRFSNDPDPTTWNRTDGLGSILVTWFLRIGALNTDARTSAHIRYLLWIEDDVAPAFNTFGMKLPGLINQNALGPAPDDPVRMYLRTFHRFPQSNTYQEADHVEDIEMGAGFPIITDFGPHFKTNRWYVIEQYASLNTPGVANGTLTYWCNGNQVFSRSDVNFRDRADTLFRAYHCNVYHGGLNTPKGLMHYRLAKLAVSSSYIGVPRELLGAGVTPTWRVPMTTIGQVYEIANTVHMATTAVGQADHVPDALGGGIPLNWGKNFENVACFGGYAFDTHNIWSVATGGHNGQWWNGVMNCDLDLNQPLWKLQYSASAENNYNSTTGTALIPSLAAADGPPALFYYYDGKPCARHTYYANHYISARNRIMMFYCGSSYGGNSSRSDNVDGYNIASKVYDPAGLWTKSHIYDLTGANSNVPAGCKHPTTEDVYLKNYDQIKKWTQTTGLWSDVVIAGGSFTRSDWQFHGTLIDVARNRWVSLCDSAVIQYIDLATNIVHTIPITGDANYLTEAAWNNTGGSTIVHDLDRDLYLNIFGLTNDGVTTAFAGRIYQINPTTGVVSKFCDIPPAYTGVQNRAYWFQKYGGVVFLPSYESNLLFIPTRSVG